MRAHQPLRERSYDKASLTLALTLAAMSVFGPFSMDTVYPAFKVMGVQFGASDTAMQSVTSVYMLAFATMSLFHGPISDAVGRKPVVIVGAVLYALASVGAAFAPSLPTLLVFRAAQGMTAGSGMIIGRTVVQDLFHGAEAQRQMAMVSMVFSVAPAIAPMVGGWLLLAGPWNLIFWFLGAWGAFVAIVVAATLPESLPPTRRQPLQVMPLVRGLGVVARNLRFQRLAAALVLSFGAQFIYIASAPLLVRNLLGKGEQDFWIFFIPMIIGILTGSWVQQRFATRVRGDRLVVIGIGIAIATGLVNVVFALVPATSGRLPWAVLAPLGIAFGTQIAFPVLTVQMLALFPERRGSASSMQTFEQLLFNALLAGVVAPVAAHSVLTLALTSLGFSVLGALTLWRAMAAEKQAAEGRAHRSADLA